MLNFLAWAPNTIIPATDSNNAQCQIITHNKKHCSLLEKGKQILMKDNLIDEEKAKQEEAAQESLEQKLERIGKFRVLTKNTTKI
jgi:DNA-binding protein H-NS